MLDGIEKFLNSIMDPFKDVLESDPHNVLIVIIFFIGVLVFFLTYEALHKDR